MTGIAGTSVALSIPMAAAVAAPNQGRTIVTILEPASASAVLHCPHQGQLNIITKLTLPAAIAA